VRVLAVSGSLQQESANSALVRRIAAEAGPPLAVTVHESLDGLPHFSPDRHADSAVGRWRAAVAEADAIVVATPEYAGGMPGVLKNALDWLVGSGELYGKPAVVVSAAPSAERGGGARGSVVLTLRMQGADVRDSFTVAVHGGASDADVVARIGDALLMTS
jgi:NAD(P)H-dependent FMN reductase